MRNQSTMLRGRSSTDSAVAVAGGDAKHRTIGALPYSRELSPLYETTAAMASTSMPQQMMSPLTPAPTTPGAESSIGTASSSQQTVSARSDQAPSSSTSTSGQAHPPRRKKQRLSKIEPPLLLAPITLTSHLEASAASATASTSTTASAVANHLSTHQAQLRHAHDELRIDIATLEIQRREYRSARKVLDERIAALTQRIAERRSARTLRRADDTDPAPSSAPGPRPKALVKMPAGAAQRAVKSDRIAQLCYNREKAQAPDAQEDYQVSHNLLNRFRPAPLAPTSASSASAGPTTMHPEDLLLHEAVQRYLYPATLDRGQNFQPRILAIPKKPPRPPRRKKKSVSLDEALSSLSASQTQATEGGGQAVFDSFLAQLAQSTPGPSSSAAAAPSSTILSLPSSISTPLDAGPVSQPHHYRDFVTDPLAESAFDLFAAIATSEMTPGAARGATTTFASSRAGTPPPSKTDGGALLPVPISPSAPSTHAHRGGAGGVTLGEDDHVFSEAHWASDFARAGGEVRHGNGGGDAGQSQQRHGSLDHSQQQHKAGVGNGGAESGPSADEVAAIAEIMSSFMPRGHVGDSHGPDHFGAGWADASHGLKALGEERIADGEQAHGHSLDQEEEEEDELDDDDDEGCGDYGGSNGARRAGRPLVEDIDMNLDFDTLMERLGDG
ncbi:hypothetical protein V8E36_001870 [Tilletia maclaganii]